MPVNFLYNKIYSDLVETFKFGDTFRSKAKEIGVSYSDFRKLNKGESIKVEPLLLIFNYLKQFSKDGDIEEDGPPLEKVLSEEQALGLVLARYLVFEKND